MKSSLADKIGIEGEEKSIVMNTLNKRERKTGIIGENVGIEAIDGSYSAPLNCLALDYKPKAEIQDVVRIKKKYRHLQDIHFPKIESKEVGLVLGRDNMHLIHALEVRQGRVGQPWAMRFSLGWSLTTPDSEEEEDN